MLNKSKIQNVQIGSDEWIQKRLGKFTASEIYYLIGEGESAINYIRRKVGEEMTGQPAKGDVDVNATRHGLMQEADALNKFGLQMGLSFLVTQQLVAENVSRFGCTPDGLIVIRESPDQTEYEVEPVEVKCPITFDNYIKYFECETPLDLKRESKQYYYQVLDQLDNCESLSGYFVAYHPDFKRGNMKILKVDTNYSFTDAKGKKQFPVYQDLKILRERKKWAEEKFSEIRNKLMSVDRI